MGVAMSQHPSRKPLGSLPRSIRDPDASSDRLDTLAVLVHELSGLLDGSMRCLDLAQRNICAAGLVAAELDSARAQLDTVQVALERMSDLVHGAMTASANSISGMAATGRPVTMAEAIAHAVDVVKPVAGANHITLDVRADARMGEIPAGPLYVVLLNGLRNAVESVARTSEPGSVRVSAMVQEEGTRPWVIVEIEDDGVGLPRSITPERLFEPGVTTKPRGEGIGLALSRQIAVDLGGRLEIASNGGPRQRRGALLRLACPAPEAWAGPAIGGDAR